MRKLVAVLSFVVLPASGCRKCERPEFRFSPSEAEAAAYVITLVRDLSVDPNEALKEGQLGTLQISYKFANSNGPTSICGDTTDFPVRPRLTLGAWRTGGHDVKATLSSTGNLSFTLHSGEGFDTTTLETYTRSFVADIDLSTEDATVFVFDGDTTEGRAEEWFATYNSEFGNQHWQSD